MLLHKNRLKSRYSCRKVGPKEKGGGGVRLNVSRPRDLVGIYLINTQRLPRLGQQKVQTHKSKPFGHHVSQVTRASAELQSSS